MFAPALTLALREEIGDNNVRPNPMAFVEGWIPVAKDGSETTPLSPEDMTVLAGLLERGTAGDERAFDQYQRSKIAAFPREIRTAGEELPSLLDRSYDSLLWEATARRCYSCGSCNLSCPTCYCFNIFDDVNMTLVGGERKREWDGCQLPKFAEVAGPHNFRPKAASRLRHRIYRKAKWIREQTGMAGCVGCARCDRACTAKINSVEIYNQLAEEV